MTAPATPRASHGAPLPRSPSEPVQKEAQTVDTSIAKLAREPVSFADVLRTVEAAASAPPVQIASLPSAIASEGVAGLPAPTASMFNEDGFFQGLALGAPKSSLLAQGADPASTSTEVKDLALSPRGEPLQSGSIESRTSPIGSLQARSDIDMRPTANQPRHGAEPLVPNKSNSKGSSSQSSFAFSAAESPEVHRSEQDAVASLRSSKRSLRSTLEPNNALKVALNAAGTAVEFIGRIDRISKGDKNRLRNALSGLLSQHGLGLKSMILNGHAALKSILGSR